MSNQIILITGSNGDLGRAMARAFLDESPTNFVWLAVHRRRDPADEMASANPDRVRVVQAHPP